MKLSFDRNHQIFNCFRNSFRNALLCRSRSAEKIRCCKAFQGFCDRCARKFSRPPRYDHFDIPPYKRNYEIVLEKTLEEKTLLSEKCTYFPQTRVFSPVASAMARRFQDRLVMTASITLRIKYSVLRGRGPLRIGCRCCG